MSVSEQIVAELVAKEAIRTAMVAYARSVDRRDWDGMRDAYHPDAYDDHGDYKGDVDGLIAWVRQRHATVEQSMHFLGNQHIQMICEDRALVETYCVVNQRYGPEAIDTVRLWLGEGYTLGPDDRISADLYCRYIDHFERRDSVWRIARRVLVMEEVRAVSVQASLLKPAWVLARRDKDDALWIEMKLAKLRVPTPH